MARRVSRDSRAGDRSPRRSWRIGPRCWTKPWCGPPSRCWTYEKAARRSRTCALRGQGRHRQRRTDLQEGQGLSAAREAGDGGAGRAAFSRHDQGPGRALRAAQSSRAQLPASRRAGRRRHDLAQDRRAGESLFDGAAQDGNRGEAVSERVDVTVAGGGLTATLNRPDKRNAIDTAMIDDLLAALERADLDASVRVVALRGAGRDFCAGMDLSELLASADHSLEQNRQAALHFAQIFVRMRRLPKIVVALVQGRALAGGCGLASACDLVLATESAQFGYPEVQRGFVPAIVMTMLRRAVGEKIAFDLAATGRLLNGTEAAAVGLASRVYEDADFEEQAGEVLRVLAEASASALAFTKQQFYQLDGIAFEDGLRLGADVNAVSRSTPDFRAALSAFLKK